MDGNNGVLNKKARMAKEGKQFVEVKFEAKVF